MWLKGYHQGPFKHHLFLQRWGDLMNLCLPNRIMGSASEPLWDVPEADIRIPSFFQNGNEHFRALSDLLFEVFGHFQALVDRLGETRDALCSPAEPEFEGVWSTAALSFPNLIWYFKFIENAKNVISRLSFETKLFVIFRKS